MSARSASAYQGQSATLGSRFRGPRLSSSPISITITTSISHNLRLLLPARVTRPWPLAPVCRLLREIDRDSAAQVAAQ
eukprot:1637910-Rhodomonas_salina.3